MQEKSTLIFERFPESEGLQQIKEWFAESGYNWIHIKGDSCAYIPFNQPVLDDLQKPSLQNKDLFIKRMAAGNEIYIYVSVSNLAREFLQNNAAMLNEVQIQVKTFHEEQITPGEVVFDASLYQISEKGVYQAFSDIAHQQMEYRTIKEDRLLVSRTLTKENAEQLLGVFKIVFPGIKISVNESSVNPGFYRVMVNEKGALSALKKAKTNLQEVETAKKCVAFTSTGYTVENILNDADTYILSPKQDILNHKASWVKQISKAPDLKRKDDTLFKRPEGSPPKRIRTNSQTLGL